MQLAVAKTAKTPKQDPANCAVVVLKDGEANAPCPIDDLEKDEKRFGDGTCGKQIKYP